MLTLGDVVAAYTIFQGFLPMAYILNAGEFVRCVQEREKEPQKRVMQYSKRLRQNTTLKEVKSLIMSDGVTDA